MRSVNNLDNPLVRLIRGEITVEQYVEDLKHRVDELLEQERTHRRSQRWYEKLGDSISRRRIDE
jgi:hypothetical protein